MNRHLDEMLKGEAEYFDNSARKRTSRGQIPLEADLRRATRYIPQAPGEEHIDPKMNYLLEGKLRDKLLDYVSHQPNGRVVEVCCGPGWLALELGRKGQFVDAYDISPGAIAVAKKTLSENPYKDHFGSVTYHLQDVVEVDLGENSLDAMLGYSAYHHLHDLPQFMERAYRAIKSGGVIATVDDMPRGRLEKWLHRILCLLLPTYDRTYGQKLHDIYLRLIGATKELPDHFTPMEEFAAKDHAVFEIADIFYEKYEVLLDVRWAAFAAGPITAVKGPDWFRYSVAHVLLAIDSLFCRIGLCKGFLRMIVARKP